MPVKFLMPKLITQYDKAAETHSEIIAWDVNYGAWFFMRYKPSSDRFYLNGGGDLGFPSHYYTQGGWNYANRSQGLDTELYRYLPIDKMSTKTYYILPPDAEVVYEL